MYVSDLARARQTAEPIEAATGVRAQPMDELREIFLGEWEGLHTTELAARFPEQWAKWTAEPSWDIIPGGEGAAAFDARVAAAIDVILARHPESDVAVVTHGGVIQVALHRIVGKPSRGLFPFRIANASISVIEKRDGRIVIAGVNDVGHLEPS
jgi:probable phosphoglycerate mutase